MKNIEIKSTGSYLPKIEVNNQQLEKELKLEEGYIEKRTGIEKRYYAKNETIEEIAEKEMIRFYQKDRACRAIVLKVAHHGSKSSSTQPFLEIVKPKIALIGVGENNTFGHPNEGVLERLEKIGAKIYRTDEKGEISLKVNNKGQIKINTKIGK